MSVFFTNAHGFNLFYTSVEERETWRVSVNSSNITQQDGAELSFKAKHSEFWLPGFLNTQGNTQRAWSAPFWKVEEVSTKKVMVELWLKEWVVFLEENGGKVIPSHESVVCTFRKRFSVLATCYPQQRLEMTRQGVVNRSWSKRKISSLLRKLFYCKQVRIGKKCTGIFACGQQTMYMVTYS